MIRRADLVNTEIQRLGAFSRKIYDILITFHTSVHAFLEYTELAISVLNSISQKRCSICVPYYFLVHFVTGDNYYCSCHKYMYASCGNTTASAILEHVIKVIDSFEYSAFMLSAKTMQHGGPSLWMPKYIVPSIALHCKQNRKITGD